MDHPGSDPVWDWAVASSLSGISQPSMNREHRYSAMPHIVDQSLPIYMRPISLDIGLPPSSYVPPTTHTTSFGTAETTKQETKTSPRQAALHLPLGSLSSSSQTETTIPATIESQNQSSSHPVSSPTPTFHNILAASPATYTPPDPERSVSPRPYGAQPGSIKLEMAHRTIVPASSTGPVLDTAVSHRTSGHQADLIPAALRSISPPVNRVEIPATVLPETGLQTSIESTLATSARNGAEHHTHTTSWEVASPRNQLEPEETPADVAAVASQLQLSPRSPASFSPASPDSPSSVTSNTSRSSSPTPSKGTTGAISPRPLSPSSFSDSGAWLSTAVPSEAVLEPYIEETTGQSKSMQSSGNAARERRRNRRPTYDSQHPPEFKDIERILSNSRNNSTISQPADSGTSSPSQSSEERSI